MKEMMKEIFKEPYIPEYNSSSESECDDDKDDNSVEEDHEMGTYKKDEADNNNEEEMANKKATNKKTNAEFDPFDDPEFGKYYVENEHLFVPTQPRAEKKKDQTDEKSAARMRTTKKRQKRIGSSSQDTPVFGIDNSLQGSQPTFDLGGSPTYEKMKIITEKEKEKGTKIQIRKQDGGPNRRTYRE
ncbi:hypothetical protein Tco_0518335 [Tanacetum coccineum]